MYTTYMYIVYEGVHIMVIPGDSLYEKQPYSGEE